MFRLLSCLYALGFQVAINSDLDHPLAGWLLFGVLIGASVAFAVAYLHGIGRAPAWVITEIVVVLALVLSTEFIAGEQWVADNQSWPTTLWATNAVISAAIQFGPIAGMLTGLLVMAASAVIKGYVHIDLGRHATLVIELAVGLAVGMAAQTARRAHAELQRANVIGVVNHGFLVARVFGFDFRTETGGFIFGIVQLGKAVGDFATTDEKLKTIRHLRIIRTAPRQR